MADVIKKTVAQASQQIDFALQEAVKVKLKETVEQITAPLENSARRATNMLNEYVNHTAKEEWKMLGILISISVL